MYGTRIESVLLRRMQLARNEVSDLKIKILGILPIMTAKSRGGSTDSNVHSVSLRHFMMPTQVNIIYTDHTDLTQARLNNMNFLSLK